MEVTISRIDDFGRGITFVDGKITFVDNALPEEVVEIKIVKESKKFNEAVVVKYIKESDKRVLPICPNFNKCGGCQFMNMDKSLEGDFKLNKVKYAFSKFAKVDIDAEYHECNELHYRNKITLKINNGVVGYYENNTNKLVKVDVCLLARDEINAFLPVIKSFGIYNGEIVIRVNYNKELLISINTRDFIVMPDNLKDYKVVGVVVNNKTKYGENKFMELMNDKFYQISYNSFFQVNNEVASSVLDLIGEKIIPNSTVLDLYCGVGMLGLSVGEKIKKLYGIEIVENAVINAVKNAEINKFEDTSFLLGEASRVIGKVEGKFDSIIVDPPRGGLDKYTIAEVLNMNPKQIIYMSCDPITLARDVNILKENYEMKSVDVFNMFPKTYHVESVVTLYRKN